MSKRPFIATRELVIYPGIVTPIFIGRQVSLASLEEAIANYDSKLVLSTQIDASIEEPTLPGDVYKIGVVVHVIQTVKMPNGTVKVLVEAKNRAIINQFYKENNGIYCEYEEVFTKPADENKVEILRKKVIQEFEKYVNETQKVLPDVVYNIKEIKSIDKVFDLICTNLAINTKYKQELLEILDIEERAYKILSMIEREIQIFNLEKDIEVKVKDQMAELQKNYYLREKIKVIKDEIGEDDSEEEIEELASKVEKANIPKELREKLQKEIVRMKKMPDFSAESSVIRTYVDTVLELPWDKSTDDELDVEKAQKILNEDHYGLEEVKERILEFLAVKKLNNSLKGSIICLVGPPGVGKTSLAHSIARSMNREFTRISLGGVRDEAEIRGHRRTYVGSMPGRVINAIKQVGVNNPVILFDEIDKMASDFRGDPASAMLEVLDPAQNHTFEDHYIDYPFNLSNVFFVCTANDLGGIPGPLRDRMEIIHIESYTEFEKLNIAKKYLIPQTQEENGLKDYKIKFSDEAIFKIINEYTREAGVRNLRREIGKLFRKMAKEVVISKAKKLSSVTDKKIKEFLGNPKFREDKIKEKTGKIGVVNGLAWTAVGGTMLEVQAVKMEGKGGLQFTGKLGEVMQESAKVAYSFVRHIKNEFNIKEKFNETTDIHLHFPEGAVPKDGPSAGITITTAIISVLTDKEVRQDVAMTGEITITGEVLAIGGVKEKVIAAHRVGIRDVILPFDNKIDTEELPKEIIKDMKFHFAKVYDDVKKVVFVDESKDEKPKKTVKKIVKKDKTK